MSTHNIVMTIVLVDGAPNFTTQHGTSAAAAAALHAGLGKLVQVQDHLVFLVLETTLLVEG